MSDIFLSYASADRERARTLATALEARGWSVWWDRKIAAGQTFDQIIERELEAAAAIVVLWSTTSIDSEWVRNEATVGADRGVLIPALIDDVKPPLAFRRKQTSDLAKWNGEPSHEGFQSLCQGLAALAAPGAPSPLAPPSLTSARRSRPGRKTLLLCALGALLGLFAVRLLLNLQSKPERAEPMRPEAPKAPEAPEAVNEAFIKAAKMGEANALADLLKRGADLKAVGTQSLREAADSRVWGSNSVVQERQQLDTLTFFLQRGIDVNTRDKDGITPLMLATRAASSAEPAAAVRLLVENGADVHARCKCSLCDSRGSHECTALMIAARNGHRDSVQILLDKGAKIDEATDAHRTALMLAADAAVIRLLLEKGAACELRDAEGKNALMFAINEPSVPDDAVLALTKCTAHLDVPDLSGRSPLTWAAVTGRVEIVRTLIKNHAALNRKTIKGRTPLMLAVMNGNKDVVQLLVRSGARLLERDLAGQTALQLAREELSGEIRGEIVYLLTSAGAK